MRTCHRQFAPAIDNPHHPLRGCPISCDLKFTMSMHSNVSICSRFISQILFSLFLGTSTTIGHPLSPMRVASFVLQWRAYRSYPSLPIFFKRGTAQHYCTISTDRSHLVMRDAHSSLTLTRGVGSVDHGHWILHSDPDTRWFPTTGKSGNEQQLPGH